MSAGSKISLSGTIFSGGSSGELQYLDGSGDLRVVGFGRYSSFGSPPSGIEVGSLIFFGVNGLPYGKYIGTVAPYNGSGRYFYGERASIAGGVLPYEVVTGPDNVPFIHGSSIYWNAYEAGVRRTWVVTGSLPFLS